MHAVLETGFVLVAAIDHEITNEDPILRELELGEINGQCKTVVNDLETIETACEAIEELSDLSDILSKNNAIGSDAASLAAISTESICRRLGYVSEKPIMPSMESFSFTNSRKQATEYTLESLGQIASDVWEAIKKFFAKIIEGIKKVFKFIKDFIMKILRKMGFLKEQVQVIYKDKVNVYESERTVDFSPFCVSFNVPKAKDLHGKVTDVLENSLNVSKALININNALSTFYEVAISAKDIHGLILETRNSGFNVDEFKLKEIDKTDEYVTVGEFINAKHIRFYKKDYKVEIVDGQRVTVNDGSMVISKELDLPNLVTATEKLAKSIEDNAKREDRLKKLTSVMTKAADSIVKKAKNSEENKAAARMFKVMSSSTINTTSNLLQLVTQNLTESLKYIEFCKRELLVNVKENETKVA